MPMTYEEQLKAGAQNLLKNCVNLRPEQTLLLVTEDKRAAYYDEDVVNCIKQEAENIGATVYTLSAPRISGPEHSPAIVKRALESVDHTVFLARIGDQMRFHKLPGEGSKTMCYTLDGKMLVSEAGRSSYKVASALLEKIQSYIDTISQWRIQCPLGTDLIGTSDSDQYTDTARLDFSVKLFPPGPFRPLLCNTANGKIVTKLLPASATHLYEPFGLVLDSPVTMMVCNGRIVEFTGEPEVAKRVENHYRFVGKKFDIDPFVVHSWHTGTNPKIYYPDSALENIERWNGVVHSHTRYTHIHTCGNYGPGEISCGLIDATLTFDDHPLWVDGRLLFLESEEALAIRRRYGATAPGYETCLDIGL